MKGNGYGRRGGTAPGKPVHKQEARLKRWQSDRKQKPFVPMHAPTVAGAKKWIGATDSNAEGTTGSKRQYSKQDDSRPQKAAKTSDNYNNKATFEKTDNRSLWEKSGGISAQSVTAATIQKNKGSIARSEGKKITFD